MRRRFAASTAAVLALKAFALGGFATAAQAEPQVVVSIKPLYGLVARVMEGVGEPTLLVTGGASLHTYSLRPSQAAALERADLVVWIGPSFETFLRQPLESLGANARQVEAFEVAGIELLPARVGGSWERHEHDHDHDHDHDEAEADEHDHDHDHDHADEEQAADEHDHAREGSLDGHLWLDPHNAEAVTRALVEALSEIDPANKERYAQNGAALLADIEALDRDLAEQLAPVSALPYVVFHDAYQYFEAHYGLNAVGSITVSPEQQPGAQRLGEIRDKIVELGAVCVFAEPEFQPALVNTLVEGTSARVAVLDPEGANLQPTTQTYEELMRNLASALKDCLGPAT